MFVIHTSRWHQEEEATQKIINCYFPKCVYGRTNPNCAQRHVNKVIIFFSFSLYFNWNLSLRRQQSNQIIKYLQYYAFDYFKKKKFQFIIWFVFYYYKCLLISAIDALFSMTGFCYCLLIYFTFFSLSLCLLYFYYYYV